MTGDLNALVARGLDALERELPEDAAGTFRLCLLTSEGEFHVYAVVYSDGTASRSDLSARLTVHMVIAGKAGAPYDLDHCDWLLREPDPSAPGLACGLYTILPAKEAIAAATAVLAGKPKPEVTEANVHGAKLMVCMSTGEWFEIEEAYDGIAIGLMFRVAAGSGPEVQS